MRMLRLVIAATAVSAPTARAPAQQPIRVIRHAPADTARSGDVITVTFDRPVAGSPERSSDPTRFVSVEPALSAAIEWRDPVTLRVIPAEPLPPGRRYRITIDTTFTAVDGGRLSAPYEFTVQTRGPRLLASVPSLNATGSPLLDPAGTLTLVYSAPVDTAELLRVARLEVRAGRGCEPQVIRYTSATQRAVAESDGYPLWYAGFDNESVDRRFRRIIALRLETRPPESCAGTLIIPSFDATDRPEIRFPTTTYPRFELAALRCASEDCAASPALWVWFTVPVRRNDLVSRLHVEPPVPFTVDESETALGTWTLRLAVKPRTTYRVRVDSTLTDVFGRRVAGRREASIEVRDRKATLGHQLGFFTIPARRPVLRLTHVNVDSAELLIVPIPDSLRALMVLQAGGPDSVARMVGRLRDTVRYTVALHAALNEERITEIPIPPAVLTRSHGSLLAIRARSIVVPRRPPATDSATPGILPTVVVLAERESPSARVAVVQVTDIMAHAKVADGWGAVFVTDVNDGQPVTGARVSVRDNRDSAIASGVTSATGVADIRVSPTWHPPVRSGPVDGRYRGYGWYDGDAQLVEVTRGDDRSLTPIPRAQYASWPPEGSVIDGSYDRARFVRGMVHTERAIYRPAEPVYLSAILREGWLGDLRQLPPGDSIRIHVEASTRGASESEVVRDTIVRLNAFGTAADSFVLARTATLGDYTARVDAMSPDGWRNAAWTSFRVAEYRAPEFRASLALDSAVHFLGDTLRAHVDASYYFGAAMAGAVVHWHGATGELREPLAIPGLPDGFLIGQQFRGGPDREPVGGSVSGVDTLDANGRLTLRVPTTPGSLAGPSEVDVQIAVDDRNRQSVAAEQSAVVHASSFYLAVRDTTRAWYWKPNEPRTLQLLAVRPDGRRESGLRVRVAVIRHRSVYASDASYPQARWVTDTVLRDSLTTADSIVRFRFMPRAEGSYEVLFRARDARERPLATSLGRYVLSPRWTAAWGQNPVSLAMRVSPDTVAPGDSATVSIISPFARAEAWMTVEREGILAQRRLTVPRGETLIKVAVTRQFVPDAVVSVLLVDASAAWQTDSLHRRIRRGRATLTVDRAAKALTVDVKPAATRYAPGDSATIEVRVLDRRGHAVPGQVTLWAVDEGVLALTEYERPDPLDVMYASRGSALAFATTASSLASLGRLLAPNGWFVTIRGSMAMNASIQMSNVVMTGMATTSPVAENVLRSDFRTTAFYLSSLIADSSGTAAARVKLPDNLTTYRLIAVAVTRDDRFGSGESTVVVTKPLLARSALPRFVRTGDDFVAGAVITNQTGGSLSVRARASGRAVVSRDSGEAVRALANGASSEVRFGWRVDAPPGDTVAFRFDVNGGTNGDAVETSLLVRPPYSPRYHAMAGIARDGATVRMMLPRGLDPARSRLTLRVGTTPVPAIRAAYERLSVYPYLCTEQLSSTGMVIVAMLRLQQAGVIDSAAAPDARTLRARLQFVVDELSRRQGGDGGIGYWTSAGWSTTPLTAYAGLLLVDARELGIVVSARVLAGLAEFVRGRSETDPWLPDTAYGTREQGERAVAARLAWELSALHYLRRSGFPDIAGEERVLAGERAMLWEDRVWLADLLARGADQSAARAVLARAWRDIEVAGTRLDVPDSLLRTFGFRSHMRPVARLLRATLAIDSTDSRLPLLIERVVQQGRADRDRVWNTQDYAAATEALAEVARWQRGESREAAVTVRSARRGRGSRVVARGAVGASADSAVTLDGLVERDGDWIVLPLRIEGTGGRIFYTLTVDEVPLAPPTTPDARGIIVERWYERFDDGRPTTEVKEGELVRGRLRITVPSDREFVAVEDMLPAGLEVVDLSLRTSRTVGPFESDASDAAERSGDRANRASGGTPWLYGTWAYGWWSPWEHTEMRDDRVLYFARTLWKGTYTASYVARATTAGTFVRPPAHAEEMYNPSLGGRSEGGMFRVVR